MTFFYLQTSLQVVSSCAQRNLWPGNVRSQDCLHDMLGMNLMSVIRPDTAKEFGVTVLFNKLILEFLAEILRRFVLIKWHQN